MIVVSIELHSANTGKKTLLGRAIIANDGTGSGTLGNYDVKIANKRDVNDLPKIGKSPQRTGRVENYPRLTYNVWRLIARAILAAFPEEKKS